MLQIQISPVSSTQHVLDADFESFSHSLKEAPTKTRCALCFIDHLQFRVKCCCYSHRQVELWITAIAYAESCRVTKMYAQWPVIKDIYTL